MTHMHISVHHAARVTLQHDPEAHGWMNLIAYDADGMPITNIVIHHIKAVEMLPDAPPSGAAP